MRSDLAKATSHVLGDKDYKICNEGDKKSSGREKSNNIDGPGSRTQNTYQQPIDLNACSPLYCR
jgi:hypothetical protein